MRAEAKAVIAALIAGGLVSSSAVADVTITLPPKGCALQLISGKIVPPPSTPGKRVWVVINPLETPGNYWPQDPLTANSKGDWQGYVHIGEKGKHVGLQFQLRAFVDPDPIPTPGRVMTDWPSSAAMSSDLVQVVRGDC
jgi:hypothetical protein